MKVETRAEVFIPRPVEVVFDQAFEPDAFGQRLKATGPIPGITAVEFDGGESGPSAVREGVRRTVSMSDKTTVREEITRHARPYEHSYRWLTPPAAPFNLLVVTAETTFRLEKAEGGTRVVWTYWFTLTSRLVQLPMMAVQYFFRKWMQNGLDRLKGELAAN
jgi:hypothetical protein